MRRFLFPLFLMTLACFSSAAQERMRLEGFLQVPGKELMSYYVDFTVKETKINGYSITDWRGGSRERASLTGTRSPFSELDIREVVSLDNRPAFTIFCYFSARLKLTIINGRQRWSGPFESHQPDGTFCERGIMTLMDNAPDLDASPAKPAPRPALPAPKPVPVVVAPPPKPLPPPKPKPRPRPAVVADTPKARPVVAAAPLPKRDTAHPKPRPVVKVIQPVSVPVQVAAPAAPDTCLRRYEWNGPTLGIAVSDGFTIDGDVISIAIGGRTLLDHGLLGREQQHFSATLSPGWNVLSIGLHEPGFEPPVTPNVVLTDGAVQHEISISGERGQTATICIFRK